MASAMAGAYGQGVSNPWNTMRRRSSLAAIGLLVLAVAGPTGREALAADVVPSGPVQIPGLDDRAWAAIDSQTPTTRAATAHDRQPTEVDVDMRLLRMARARSGTSVAGESGDVNAMPGDPADLARATMVGHAAAGDTLPDGQPAKGVRRDVPRSGFDVMVGRQVQGGVPVGDTCALQRGGHVEVMGRDKDMGTLVRYVAPIRADRLEGTPCPTGTLAFLDGLAVVYWPGLGEVDAQERAVADLARTATDRIMGD